MIVTDGLNIFFGVRPDLSRRPGGDTVQVLNTAASLRDLGVSVTISSDTQADVSGFDCVHVWQLERVHESLAHFQNARRCERPAVLSPIYWPDSGRPRGGSWRSRFDRVVRDMQNVARLVLAESRQERQACALAVRTGWSAARRRLLESASAVLPNSHAEAQLLQQESRRPLNCIVVPNGVDDELCLQVLKDSPPTERRGMLCVGHFDPRKNQATLIRAVADGAHELTLIGEARRMHRRYYQACRRTAGPRVQFAGRLDQSQILRRMHRARLHVCPSRLETPGLANLEAAVMGCGLVLPDCPPVREYFGDDAIYFQRPDAESVRNAIEQAWEQAASPTLAQRVLRQYNWKRAAQATLEAYRQVVQADIKRRAVEASAAG